MEKETTDFTERERRYSEFVALLARHDLLIRRYVRSLLPSPDGVDDVVQDTALECWKKFANFQPVDPEDASEEFVRWACVTARYKALSWQRDKSRDRLVFRESVIEQLSRKSLETLDRAEEERMAVDTCLQKLPADQKRLVLSVYSPGESVARIAEETGVKVRRLYNRVNTVRARLLKCIEDQLEGAAANANG